MFALIVVGIVLLILIVITFWDAIKHPPSGGHS